MRSTLRRISTFGVVLGIVAVAVAAAAWDRQPPSGPVAEAAQGPGATEACDPIWLEGDTCVSAQGPAPVIPEASLPVLLPMSAGAVLIGALWLVRQRGKNRNDARGREAADGG